MCYIKYKQINFEKRKYKFTGQFHRNLKAGVKRLSECCYTSPSELVEEQDTIQLTMRTMSPVPTMMPKKVPHSIPKLIFHSKTENFTQFYIEQYKLNSPGREE